MSQIPRYAVKEFGNSWVVVDREADDNVLGDYETRQEARAHARELNEKAVSEQASKPA
jgi:hypothetical protein